MKLKWIGHACFRMTAADGTAVVTDPYDDSVGIAMLPLEADLVTMSHAHHDHCCTDMLGGAPRIVRGTENVCVGSIKSSALASFHDAENGTKRGANIIRMFKIDNFKVVHMGDQGCMPPQSVISEIADADLMLIPTGGFYTIDAAEAKAIIEKARPRCVVPMHVKTKHCGYPIAAVDAFLDAMDVRGMTPVQELTWTAEQMPHGVVLMQPEADEI